MKNIVLPIILTSITFSVGCSDDEGLECFSCVYEKRRTGCNSLIFRDWEQGSSTIDFELKDGLTPESFCRQTFPSSDTECSATCCINIQYRNVRVESCP